MPDTKRISVHMKSRTFCSHTFFATYAIIISNQLRVGLSLFRKCVIWPLSIS